MKKAVHFGAGNIGRGFIGEILHNNAFEVTFVDINATIIDSLHERQAYDVGLAAAEKKQVHIQQVDGLNNQTNPEAVVAAIADADIVTTAIGPKVLSFIAPLIAQGIERRAEQGYKGALDIVACENMIGGSTFLGQEVAEHLSEAGARYAAQWIGFPDAAVDRIVPLQKHEDPLYVEVEPFSEWIIDRSQSKTPELTLDSVVYVEDLTPYIERKLFSVNTGHATVAYTGIAAGYATIDAAMQDEVVEAALRACLAETGSLLIKKWGFDVGEHQAYIEKIVKRFKNPAISDDNHRVARTPIRKLGYDERFIRPIRELKAQGLSYAHLVDVVGKIFAYHNTDDAEAVTLQKRLQDEPLATVIRDVTGLKDAVIETAIEKAVAANA